MFDGAIKESMSAMQRLGKGGELRNDSGVRQAAARESSCRGGAVRLEGVIGLIEIVPGW